MSYVLGIDVGATKIAAAIVSGKKVSRIITIPTESSQGAKRIIGNILKIIQIFHHEKVQKIGVGIAGEVNQKKGILVSSPNMPQSFKNIPLVKIIEKASGKKTFIDNDAHCFTLAESVYGAGKKFDYVIGLTLGTGIGGGIAIRKEIYRGSRGLAGELGHMIITDDAYTNGSKSGSLEVCASGPSMTRLYKGFTGREFTPAEVEKLAIKGDKNGLRVIKIMNEGLSVAFANIIHIFDPDIIVIGGGLAHVTMIWKPAIALAKEKLLYKAYKKTKIVQSALKEKSHIIGAAMLAS